MTTSEFSYEFDLLYNNIRSNKAPGVDDYEKSLFLTQAQEYIVKSYYESFENSEKAREVLTPLVVSKNVILNSIPTTVSTDSVNNENEPNVYKYYVEIPSDCWFILNEFVELEGTSKEIPTYLKSYKMMVKPVLLDDYYKIKNNPFKGPNNRQVLRYNISYTTNLPTPPVTTVNSKVIIVSKYALTEYYVIRYLKKPSPIILFNSSATEYTGLTIDSLNTIQTSILPESVHREIVETAVNLAIKTFVDRLSGNNQQQQ